MTAVALSLTDQTQDGRMPVSELFASFQGEGVNFGRRALFARLTLCNLTCGYDKAPTTADVVPVGAMVCDTEYTWNKAKYDLVQGVRHLTPEELWADLLALDPSTADPEIAPVDLFVVTGGEPLLHMDALVRLAALATGSGRMVEIETNATIGPSEELVRVGVAFNAGLKLATSAVPRPKRIKTEVIRAIEATGNARWKFVVTGPDDLQEIAALQAEFGLTEVWLSPEGTTPATVIERMRLIADAALARGWNLTSRQHVLIWGDEHGK